MNRKMYKMVVRQAMLCGFEEERTEERMGAELEEAEMKLLVTSFWEQQGWRGSRTRTSEVRRRCFKHVLRRDREGRRMLRMELPRRTPGGRPKTGYMDVVREDMESV